MRDTGLVQLIRRLGGTPTGDKEKDIKLARELMKSTGRICYGDKKR